MAIQPSHSGGSCSRHRRWPPMSVEPLPSGRWRARWLTKEGIHAGKTFDTKEEAEAYDHALKAERKRLRRQRVYTGHTFNEVLYRHFERKIEAEKWTDESRRTFESSWRLIVRTSVTSASTSSARETRSACKQGFCGSCGSTPLRRTSSLRRTRLG